MMNLMRLAAIVMLAVLALSAGLTGCGARQQGADLPLEPSLRADLAELDAMPTPQGADAATFSMLKANLRAMLIERGASKSASATSAPLTNRSKVIDLFIAENAGEVHFTWTYLNEGDFNLDGQVNIQDLAILGIHFGKTKASADWATARAADGNGDGQISVGDLTSLGLGFNHRVTRYVIEHSTLVGSGESWTAVMNVALAESSVIPGLRLFDYVLAAPENGFFRVVPGDSIGTGIPGEATPWGIDHRGNWWTFGRDPKHTRRSPFHGPTTNKVKWTFMAGGEIISSPALNAAGTIYIAEVGGLVHALTPNGSIIWTHMCGGDIWSSPAVGADGTIYIASDDGMLNAINPDGTTSWTFDLGAGSKYPPVIGSDGTIFIGNGLNLIALNSSGALKWCRYDLYPRQAPAIGDGGIIYVNSDNGLISLTYDGVIQWTAATGIGGSSPAVGADGTIYVGSQDDSLYAVRDDGTLYWFYATSDDIISSPAIGDDGTVYFGSYDHNFYALNPNGTLKWQHATGDIIQASPAICGDGAIYFPCVDGDIYRMSPAGVVDWRYVVPFGFYSSPAIGPDGTVYVGGMNYKFYAFGPGA
jgi:outer membrane protein assembly factor BamB